MKRILSVSLLLALISFSSAFAKEPIRSVVGMVTKVSDGDTIHLTDDLGTKLKVRLYGIDAPETEKSNRKTGKVSKAGQPYGEEAFRALDDKVFRKRVRVDIMAIDQYQRFVGIIWLGDRNINKEMVAEGYAWAYRQYLDRPHASEYIVAEKQARDRRLGLWVQDNPEPPWEFRKQQKKGKHKAY